MKSVAQELTDEIFKISQGLGYKTGINANQITSYPFVVIHRADTQFRTTKTTVFGRFFIDIDVWGRTPKDTGVLSDGLMSALMQSIELSNGTHARLDLNASVVRNLDELDPELYRNLLELEFTQI